ncbi:MAG: 2-aminoethylphosphonate aminotransferase [Gammaproteobacteria bacterium]|nr:2-aminoethylphosphonate aminotransferase [Gammaproteobacteria bacterium]MBI5615358.1 2-aminoethylphosphonate aminotransferase [Gammaproteobacteria bacterium]
MKAILLNPGPVTLSDGVRAALQRPDLCHREPEFATLQQGLRDKLLAVYGLAGDTWAATLLTGSGTAAVEAMLISMMPAEGAMLVIENGVYGERMLAIAHAYGIPALGLSHAWAEKIDMERVHAALDENPRIAHVAVVHHETTSGRLNDLHELAATCRERGLWLLLDAVSSFGAEALDFAEWPIAACAATANKCLHGVPGTSFVIARRERLARGAKRGMYLDLSRYLAQQDAGGTPFTQSVQTFYALDAALGEFFAAGGVAARHALYAGRLGRVRGTLRRLGVAPLLPDGDCSCVLHAFELPSGTDYAALHDALKARGFVIYAGQGRLASRIFRISTMGEIGEDDLARLCAALEAFFAV